MFGIKTVSPLQGLAFWRPDSRSFAPGFRLPPLRGSLRNPLRQLAFSTPLQALLFSFLALVGPLRAADPSHYTLLLDGTVAGNDVIAVGERGTILRSTDNATTWQTAPSGAQATLTGVSFAADNQHGWAVGHDALILASSDAGKTWAKQLEGKKSTGDAPGPRGASAPPSIEDSFLDVLALDAQHAIAIGAYGLYCETQDGGKTWTRRKVLDDDYHLNRITRGSGDTLYLAGEHGTLLRSKDRGAKWEPLHTPYDGSFYGVLPLDARTLLAYGLRGRVYRSADEGATWEEVAVPEPALLATATKLKSNFIALAGSARAILLSRDYGKTFAVMTSLPSPVAELLELPNGNLLALGEGGATLFPNPQ
jgi:photosystem II stability/assembly factor-like uncharacterized protein